MDNGHTHTAHSFCLFFLRFGVLIHFNFYIHIKLQLSVMFLLFFLNVVEYVSALVCGKEFGHKSAHDLNVQYEPL